MNYKDVDSLSVSDYTYNEDVVIKGGGGHIFDNVTFGNLQILVDRDIDNIKFLNCTLTKRTLISYFGDSGVASNIVFDGGSLSGLQIYYRDYDQQVMVNNRRTKGLVVRNMDAVRSPYAPYMPLGADNPILEHNTASRCGGEMVNAFQISGCLNPIIKDNIISQSFSTTQGDGHGIILDWANKKHPTYDAEVYRNFCIGHTSGEKTAGINNYRAIRSTIRGNHLIGNNAAMKFAVYDDFNAYDNYLKGNKVERYIWDGATDKGYGRQIIL